jgi:large subunit ribosomal protein L24e
MPTCTFTGQEIPPGTGKMYVRKDGSILWFSSRMAEKNFLKLKRNPRLVDYTVQGRKAKQQRMAAAAHVKEAKPTDVKPEAKAKKAKKA